MISLHNTKQSSNQTGTMFYTRLSDRPGAYRVRFKSFHGGFENEQKLGQLEEIYDNYILFKYGKPRRKIKSSMQMSRTTFNKAQIQKTANLKDRTRENESLKKRLNEMKFSRKKILDSMKDIKS